MLDTILAVDPKIPRLRRIHAGRFSGDCPIMLINCPNVYCPTRPLMLLNEQYSMHVSKPYAFLHQTDLFRPYNDPDDHWDLVCAFAIAKAHGVQLRGVLIDYPPGPPVLNHACDPDVASVAQVIQIAELWPPIAIGHPTLFSDRSNVLPTEETGGVRFVLDTLRRSPEGIAITIVGSARDIAEAITREPSLFENRCRGIYLNAGVGTPDQSATKAGEWNVRIDPAAYAKIFEAPCPIYWMPCLEDEFLAPGTCSREYATFYQFRQGEILDHLPKKLRSYFGWMFAKDASSTWLKSLESDFEEVLTVQREVYRQMYCTAAFFDLAGLGITRAGEAVRKTENRDDWVYSFDPIEVQCAPDGTTSWKPAAQPGNRYLFHVLDRELYPQAMTIAMRNLLLQL